MKIDNQKSNATIYGKSDKIIVPEKLTNKTEKSAAESVEGRVLTKRNIHTRIGDRTQSRKNTKLSLMNVRAAAVKDSHILNSASTPNTQGRSRMR